MFVCFAAILYFCKRFKHIKDMKHLITLSVLGWAAAFTLLFMLFSVVSQAQKGNEGLVQEEMDNQIAVLKRW